jgi:hypothetical protein
MSNCCQDAIIIDLKWGQKVKYPVRYVDFNLSTEGVSLNSVLRDADNSSIQILDVEVLDQVVNLGVATISLDTSLLSKDLIGTMLSFDVVLSLLPPSFEETVIPSDTIYVNLQPSPTLENI